MCLFIVATCVTQCEFWSASNDEQEFNIFTYIELLCDTGAHVLSSYLLQD